MTDPPITSVSPAGIALIQRWESCRLVAYQDGGGVWTIGWGTVRYPWGARVQPGDSCTQADADGYFSHDLFRFERAVDALTVNTLSQAQFDALVSFTYNVGEHAYRNSTLRRVVNADPLDRGIRKQFMRWIYDNGKMVRGLHRRRHAEADHYEETKTVCPPMPTVRR